MEQVLAISLLPGAYTQWKIAHFQGEAANPAVAGDGVVLAGDGLPNLLKYAFGLDPAVPSASGISLTLSPSALTLTYPRARAATDIAVHAYWSDDLTNWHRSGVTETMLSDGAIQMWEATVPIQASPPRLFMRLQVTPP